MCCMSVLAFLLVHAAAAAAACATSLPCTRVLFFIGILCSFPLSTKQCIVHTAAAQKGMARIVARHENEGLVGCGRVCGFVIPLFPHD